MDECFAQANDQMEITDSLIREMRQMGQPCDAYQKRYCPESTNTGRPHEDECHILNLMTQIPRRGLLTWYFVALCISNTN